MFNLDKLESDAKFYSHERKIHRDILNIPDCKPIEFESWESTTWEDDERKKNISYYQKLNENITLIIIHNLGDMTYELYLNSPNDTWYRSPLFHDKEDPILCAIYWHLMQQLEQLIK